MYSIRPYKLKDVVFRKCLCKFKLCIPALPNIKQQKKNNKTYIEENNYDTYVQYPYDEDAMSDPHYGDYPTARTDVSPPPEYTPPEDAEITPPEYTPPKKPIPDDPEVHLV